MLIPQSSGTTLPSAPSTENDFSDASTELNEGNLTSSAVGSDQTTERSQEGNSVEVSNMTDTIDATESGGIIGDIFG